MVKKIDFLIDELKGYCKNKNKPDEDYIKKLITHKNGLVVSWAAQCAAMFQFNNQIDLLITTFHRLQKNGVKNDKACLGKIGIIKALNSLNYDDVTWYINAASCVQIEQSINGKIDKAVPVRCACIEAFHRFEWHRVAKTLASLTGDSDQRVAIAAITTISCFEGREAELILITKASGTNSEHIKGACLKGLLHINSDTTDIVEKYLYSENLDFRIEAAFALAEFRSNDSFTMLKTAWEKYSDEGENCGYLLQAIGALRIPQSMEFLKSILEE